MHQHQYPPAHQSWITWGLGVAFYFTGFFHRMVPAVMADQLMVDFDIGAAALGGFASYYYYSYVAVQIPTGILADYWGPRKLLTTGTLLTSLGAFLFAFSPSILLANLGRLFIGGSIGVAWVSILKLSTRWFMPNRFAISTGLALSLGVCGALSAGVPLRLLVDLFGWRPVTFGAGIITILLAMSIWIFVRDDPVQKGYLSFATGQTDSALRPRCSLLADLKRIFRYKNTWLLTIVPSSLAGPLLSFAGLWGVPYLTTRYQLTPVKSAAIISSLLIAWAFGGPVLGALSEKIGRRKPLYFCGLCTALIGWSLVFFTKGYPLWFITFIFGLVGFASGSIIIGFAFIKESVPPALAGTVTGVCNMGMEMGPMLLQPAIGWVLDHTWKGALENGIPIYDLTAYHLAFGLMIGLSLLGTVMILFTRETYCQQFCDGEASLHISSQILTVESSLRPRARDTITNRETSKE
jgi:MFS family permease